MRWPWGCAKLGREPDLLLSFLQRDRDAFWQLAPQNLVLDLEVYDLYAQRETLGLACARIKLSVGESVYRIVNDPTERLAVSRAKFVFDFHAPRARNLWNVEVQCSAAIRETC